MRGCKKNRQRHPVARPFPGFGDGAGEGTVTAHGESDHRVAGASRMTLADRRARTVAPLISRARNPRPCQQRNRCEVTLTSYEVGGQPVEAIHDGLILGALPPAGHSAAGMATPMSRIRTSPRTRAAARAQCRERRVRAQSSWGAPRGEVGTWKSGILKAFGAAARGRFSDFQDFRSSCVWAA